MGEVWKAALLDSFNKFLEKITIFLPNLLAMLTILLIGFFFACLLRRLLLRFLKAIHFDRGSERWGLTEALSRGSLAYSPSELLACLFYWVIILITLIMGVNALEVAATQHLIAQFFDYLPHLFSAMLILVIGYLIAIFLGQAALIAAVNAGIESARLLSRLARWFLMILSWTMALYQLGIAETVIITAFSIVLGGVVLALAIAFGWGARDLAKDFLEKRTRRKNDGEKGGHPLSHV
jgi:hypothetical protein